ncbi:21943_t:CDS:2, partial [Gigaspora margarita]
TLEKLNYGIENSELEGIARSIVLLRSNVDKELSKVHIQVIDPNKLIDPRQKDFRSTVIKKFYGSVEVECKPIAGGFSHEAEFAILGKLSQSPNIIRFYGISEVDNNDVMVFEWAEHGNLKEYYTRHDIPWTRKIQIIRDICRGILFLRSVNIFHHDIRCENIFIMHNMDPKLGNFKYSRTVDALSTNLSYVAVNIVRWMAPELIKKYTDRRLDEKKYTIKSEIYSFGMLIWELCYEKIPYENLNMNEIADHVLSGKREQLSLWEFKNPIDKKIQEELTKIIDK